MNRPYTYLNSLRKVQKLTAQAESFEDQHIIRLDYIRRMHEAYMDGIAVVDPDDPRTTAGFTDSEVAYIRGEGCIICFKSNCDCDAEYQALVDNTLSNARSVEVE